MTKYGHYYQLDERKQRGRATLEVLGFKPGINKLLIHIGQSVELSVLLRTLITNTGNSMTIAGIGYISKHLFGLMEDGCVFFVRPGVKLQLISTKCEYV